MAKYVRCDGTADLSGFARHVVIDTSFREIAESDLQPRLEC